MEDNLKQDSIVDLSEMKEIPFDKIIVLNKGGISTCRYNYYKEEFIISYLSGGVDIYRNVSREDLNEFIESKTKHSLLEMWKDNKDHETLLKGEK